MPVNYQLGKIYTLVNDVNDIVYVGSTAQKYLCQRMGKHVSDSKAGTSPIYTAMQEIGPDHFRLILHHAFSCNSKDELVAEEMMTLDTIIATGKEIYNSTIGGKHGDAAKTKMSVALKGKKNSDAAKAKMALSQKGNVNAFSYGSIVLDRHQNRWVFSWQDKARKQQRKYFPCRKYGDYAAHWHAEDARRQVFPEWGNEEDCTCDDFGEIEWD